MDFDPSVQALQAFGSGMQVTAHNIANMNTPDFRAGSYTFETGPEDRGVRIVTRQDTVLANTPDWANADRAQRTQLADGTAQTTPQEALDRGMLANNVDIAREMVGMMRLERGFDTNAAVIRTVEETSGAIVNLKT